jgi:Ca-activated chloride channel family protein
MGATTMFWRLFRITVIGILVPGTLALSQNPGDTPPDKTPVNKTLKVDVDLVTLNAWVTDPHNRYVTDLTPERFQLFEDKVEQKIENVSSEDIAASVGIILDVSGSMKDKLAKARDAALTFLKMGNRNDEYFLIEFSDRARVVQDFTGSTSNLQSRLVFTEAKGRTSLFDAIYLGLEKLKQGTNPRKALLLITDGEDNRSRYTYSNVRQFLREQDVQVHSIGILSSTDPSISYGWSSRALLEKLSDETGGLAFFPDSVNELQGMCSTIAIAMQHQYFIAYRSTNTVKDGRWRKLTLKITSPKGAGRLHVKARNGYYAPTGDQVMK